MRNEPNYRSVHDPNAQNEPNSSPFQARHTGQRPVPMHIGEPNLPPQPPGTTQNMRNEPNLPHPHHPPPQKYETTPISVETPNIHSTIYNIQSLGPICPHGHPALPQLCETNPIYPCPSLAHDPNMRNEPNLNKPTNRKDVKFL